MGYYIDLETDDHGQQLTILYHRERFLLTFKTGQLVAISCPSYQLDLTNRLGYLKPGFKVPLDQHGRPHGLEKTYLTDLSSSWSSYHHGQLISTAYLKPSLEYDFPALEDYVELNPYGFFYYKAQPTNQVIIEHRLGPFLISSQDKKLKGNQLRLTGRLTRPSFYFRPDLAYYQTLFNLQPMTNLDYAIQEVRAYSSRLAEAGLNLAYLLSPELKPYYYRQSMQDFKSVVDLNFQGSANLADLAIHLMVETDNFNSELENESPDQANSTTSPLSSRRSSH